MKNVVEQVCLAAEYQRYLISSVLNNYRDYFHIYIATLFLSTYKYSLSLSACWSSTKRTSSSSH